MWYNISKEVYAMAGKTEYKRAWNEKNLDRIYLTVPQGDKVKIKTAADERGQSLNKFINKAIEEYMKSISE